MRGKRIEFSTYVFIILVLLLYAIEYFVSKHKGNFNNVSRYLITISYALVMLVTIGSSIIFLCVLRVRYGRRFFYKTRLQVSLFHNLLNFTDPCNNNCFFNRLFVQNNFQYLVLSESFNL